MTPEEYQRVRELFLTVRETPPQQRPELLKRACSGDEHLREEVESLLANDDLADTFLQTPALGPSFSVRQPESLAAPLPPGDSGHHSPNDTADSSGTSRHPAQIGQYRIVEPIGRGGMGIVYRAEQLNPRRTVALKVIRPGLQSMDLLRRFAHEGHVLGLLQHPGIAQVYEAGTADNGFGPQPFFAMELVRGQPLNEYALANHLNVPRRLQLLVKICDAVQHAHQKGIIHRDLKPANILVDDSGQPKILDFGVARATDTDVLIKTPETMPGQLIGTLAYMSPEQISGDPLQLDTRSDVYALGVICHELLTGRLPLDLSDMTIPQAARTVVEDEPPGLDTLNRNFRGDLATIVAKALEKDKSRRYQSASELAEDIRLYLADRPITARPATSLYQLRKFAKRNKPLVAGLTIALLALVAGITGTATQAVRATRARDHALEAERLAEQRRVEADRQRTEAERQAAIAQAVNDFLNQDLLAAARPERQRGRDVTVSELLDQASAAIGERFAEVPLVEASIQQTLGDAYHQLGEDTLALAHQERAAELLRAELGEQHERTLYATGRLGLTYRALGRWDDAERESVRTLESRRRLFGERDPRVLTSMNNLALLYKNQGRYAEAEKLLLRVIELGRTVLGEDDDTVLSATSNLGDCYVLVGRHDEAEPLLLRSYAANKRKHGEEHPSTLTSMSELAWLYASQSRYSEGEPLCTGALELRRRVLGEEHPQTLASMNMLAVLYKRQGRYDEAEPLCLETLAIKRRVLGKEHPSTLASLNNLGSLYATARRYADAEPIFIETLAARRRVLGDDHHTTLSSIRNLSDLYRFMRRFPEAEALAIENYERTARLKGPAHPATNKAIEFLVQLYEYAENPDEAATWRAKLPTTQPAR